MASQLIGASVWEQELYEMLTSHEENERELLREYQQVANEARSPAFSFLVSLIVEDEVRHHQLFRELASSLRTDAEMRPEGPAIPRLGHWGPDPRLVAELSERLLDHEREDLRALERLEDELDDVKDTTLWALLVKLMESDTRKHMAVLSFVRRHARRSL